MALIVCKHCGKQISSIAKVCVHCGTPINAAEEKNEAPSGIKDTPQSLTPRDKKHEEEPVSFFSHTVEERKKLEREFLLNNKKAFSYYRNSKEPIQYFLFSFFSFALVLFPFILLKILHVDNELYVVNETMKNLLVFSYYSLLVLTVSSLVYFVVEAVLQKKTNARLLYLKRFQLWLRAAKNVDLNPAFKTEKESNYFNNIDVSKL